MLVFVILLLLVSCNVEYEGFNAELLNESVPNIIAHNIVVTDVTSNNEKRILKAERVDLFEDQGLSVIYNLSYQETKDGDPVASGNVSVARLTSNREIIDLENGIDFYSNERETRVTGENLHFDRNEKILKTLFDQEIRIQEDNGTVLVGNGFNGEILKNRYSFIETSGVLKTDSDDEKQDEPVLSKTSFSTLSYTLLEKALTPHVARRPATESRDDIILAAPPPRIKPKEVATKEEVLTTDAAANETQNSIPSETANYDK